jgi:outer membrane protein assembly factor BamB
VFSTTVPIGSPSPGGQVPFNSLGTFQLNGKQKFKDVTTAPLTIWTSNNADSFFPPAPGANGGMYTTGSAGCACIQASNSGIGSQFVDVGVYIDVDTCPLCPTPIVTPTATSTPKAQFAPQSQSTPVPSAQSAGILMWSFDAGAPLRGRIATGLNGSIYFITRDSVLHGLDSAGKEIMNRQAEGAAPVVLPNGMVIAMSSASTLAAIDAGGATQWQLEIGTGPGPLAATDSTIYASAGSDLLSINSTGTLNWRVSVGRVTAAATTVDGVVVASSGGAVKSLAADGGILWEFTPAGGFSGSIAYADDVVYAGSLSGALYAIDLRTGNPIWHVGSGRAVIAGPAVAPSGTIFFGSDAVYAVTSDGQLGWTQSKVKPDSGGMSAVNYDEVFDAATDDLGAMLGSGGNYVWTSRSFGTIATTAVSASGTLYVGNTDGRIFAVR